MSNYTLKQKLIGAYGVAILLILVLTVFAVLQIRSLTSVVARAAGIHEMTHMGTLAGDLIGLERGIVLYSIFDDKSNLQQYKSRLEETSKAFTDALSRINTDLSSDSSKKNLEALRTRYEGWLAMHKEIVAALETQQVDVAQSRLAAPAFTSTVDEMRNLAETMSEVEAKRLRSEAGSAEATSLISFGVAALLSLSIGAFVLMYIRKLSNILGELTDALAGTSHEVQSLSSGVHLASQSLAQGSSQQAASLEETSASAEQITAVTRQNVENSQAAASVMGEVDGHIKAGNRTLESMLVSMSEINASSERISKIIKVIDEIAFQTNILALNAAVEAARAGESGMGFAVVADEVRNLAQRSAQAAKDTAAMIEESIAKSNDGSTKLRELSEMIGAITEGGSRVKTLVDSMSVGSREQARGIEQISKAITLMDQTTQSTAISSQESASASDKLAAQARASTEVVLQLRTLVDGRAGLSRDPVGA